METRIVSGNPKHPRRRLARSAAALLLLFPLLSAPLAVPAGAGGVAISAARGTADSDPFEDWIVNEAWERGQGEDAGALSAVPGNHLCVLYGRGAIRSPDLSFDARVDEAEQAIDGNIGAAYKLTDGTQYFFEYNTIHKVVRVRRLGADGSDNHVCPGQERTLEEGRWYHFDLHCMEGEIRWAIDGETVLEGSDTFDDSFEDATVYLQGYYASPSFRNPVLGQAEPTEGADLPEEDQSDFEFRSADSVRNFTSENGEVSWADGRLVCRFAGDDGVLCSPRFRAKAGTAYSARLPIRNTLLVRLKNDSPATSVRVSVLTSVRPDFSEERTAVFDLIPRSDFETYYFNLSACSGLSGYLEGFRFEFPGVDGGEIQIDAVTFEREEVPYEYAGQILSCTAENDLVTIKGKLAKAYRGKTVTLYETYPENYSERLIDSEIVTDVTADGADFTIEIPFMKGEMTRLSSLFLVGVDGVKVSRRFMIENYEDFGDNPYAFDLPDYTVSVTEDRFGARGDSFTDDTAAIQSAIDHVHARGGGRVVVPGDDSAYGRRYMATCIRLKDNVDLHVEEGAVIWQSPRAEEYGYEAVFGHDVPIPGVNWTHAASCHNYPLIFGDRVRNVRVTGRGIIRSSDTGGENLDSVSASIQTGCGSRIHLVPLGFFRCENVEIRGVGLRRANNYHINLRTCSNVYVADVSMLEVTCVSGDGISATVGTRHVTVDRCVFYSNDDAITLCSTYDDPRGLTWWSANPGGNNRTEDIEVRHCNLNGGHGLTFIPWGTDAPDLSLQEIRDIRVFDCVLNGGTSAVGAWPDNPYYGGPFDNSQTNDYSPVSLVRLSRNRYRGRTTLDCVQATDCLTDCGIRGAADFRYGNFERGDRQHPDWVSGLSNWGTRTGGSGASGSVDVAEEGGNHFGVLLGDAELFQGLWMSRGPHVFTLDARTSGDAAEMRVVDARTGRLLAQQAIAPSDDFTAQSLSFTLEAGASAYLGVAFRGGEGDRLCVDNAAVTSNPFVPRPYFEEDFSCPDECQLTVDGFAVTEEEGNWAANSADRIGLLTLTADHPYQDFTLTFRVRYDACLSDTDANIGVSLRRTGSGNQFDLHFHPQSRTLNLNLYQEGMKSPVQSVGDFDLETGVWHTVGISLDFGLLTWRVDDQTVMEVWVGEPLAAGQILLAGYNVACAFDDVAIRPLNQEEGETPTEAPTGSPETPPRVPTEPPTEVPTQAPTGVPTEAPTGSPEAPPARRGGCASAAAPPLLPLMIAGAWAALRRRRPREDVDRPRVSRTPRDRK